MDLSIVDRCCVFDDGKAETCAAHVLRMAFVDSVKSLKNTILLIVWNTDAIVVYCQHRPVRKIVYFDLDAAVRI